MIRAVLFDFYSVWAPDRFSFYLSASELKGPQVHKDCYDNVQQYYQGSKSLDQLIEYFKFALGYNLKADDFKLREEDIPMAIVDFIRGLHAHFVTVGVLANLSPEEFNILKSFNDKNELLETLASPLQFGMRTSLLNNELFDKVVASFNQPAENVLYVSGNPYHVDFAVSRGLNAIQFEGLTKLENTLNELLQSA